MTAKFRQALAAADDHRDPSGRISVIKRAVTGEVLAADPTVNVRFTDYFNHSFAPDMVLRWPRENRERFLFVRPTADATWLLNELALVSPHHPLVFTLEDLPAAVDHQDVGPPTARAELGQAASDTDTWITDPSGLSAMSSVRTREPSLGLLSQALMRGGRGVADGEEIRALTTTTAAGFAGASELSESRTRPAVQAIESHLDLEQSGRLTRVLRAVWEGHGGDGASFPATATVGALTDDDLSYLLAATREAPADFWRRIGRTVTTAQLGRIRVDDPSSSLQAFVSANIETLQAKGVRVVYEPLALGESEEVPRWLVARGCLALRGFDWTAYLAARLADELPPADGTPPPDLNNLMRRAAGRRVAITKVQFGRGRTAVTYESKDRIDILDDPELGIVTSDLQVTTIDSAVAVLEGGGSVGIDFSTKTAIGPTNSTFPLGSLVRSTLPLLSDLQADEVNTIGAALEGAVRQDDLFGGQPLDGPAEDRNRAIE